jgi:hypothetical protein
MREGRNRKGYASGSWGVAGGFRGGRGIGCRRARSFIPFNIAAVRCRSSVIHLRWKRYVDSKKALDCVSFRISYAGNDVCLSGPLSCTF